MSDQYRVLRCESITRCFWSCSKKSVLRAFLKFIKRRRVVEKNETAHVTTSASADIQRCISRNLSLAVESGLPLFMRSRCQSCNQDASFGLMCLLNSAAGCCLRIGHDRRFKHERVASVRSVRALHGSSCHGRAPVGVAMTMPPSSCPRQDGLVPSFDLRGGTTLRIVCRTFPPWTFFPGHCYQYLNAEILGSLIPNPNVNHKLILFASFCVLNSITTIATSSRFLERDQWSKTRTGVRWWRWTGLISGLISGENRCKQVVSRHCSDP